MNAQMIRCPIGREMCPRPEVPMATLGEECDGTPTCGWEGSCGRTLCELRLAFPVLPGNEVSQREVLERCGLPIPRMFVEIKNVQN